MCSLVACRHLARLHKDDTGPALAVLKPVEVTEGAAGNQAWAWRRLV